MEPAISIIVPVYNVGEYVKAALDSIYEQLLDDNLFEIIAVDDGSKDKSLAILKEYAQNHENLKVISQSNHGVSYARNRAMEIATGEFITLLDADDKFEKNSLPKIIEVLNKYKDVDVYYALTFWDDCKRTACHKTPINCSDYHTYTISDIPNFCNSEGGACGAFYRRHFLEEQNICFAEGVANGEDTIFNYMLFSKNPKFMFTDIELYLVTIRQGSASRSVSYDRAKRCSANIVYLNSYFRSNKLNNLEKEYIHKAIWHSVGLSVAMFVQSGVYNPYRIRQELCLNILPKVSIRTDSVGQRVKVAMYNYIFPLYIFLFILREKIIR